MLTVSVRRSKRQERKIRLYIGGLGKWLTDKIKNLCADFKCGTGFFIVEIFITIYANALRRNGNYYEYEKFNFKHREIQPG